MCQVLDRRIGGILTAKEKGRIERGNDGITR
jgi:hypothetical protein